MKRIIIIAALLFATMLPTIAIASNRCPNGTVSANGQCVRIINRRTVCAWPVQFSDGVGAVCVRR